MNIDRENTSEVQKDQPYKIPEKFASATIHYLYGLSKPSNHESVYSYLEKKKYALTADLVQEGFSPQLIENAVNSGGDGTDPNAPAFGDVASLGGILGNQQIALALIAYAANKGLLIETGIDRGIGVGPLFVSKNNPLASIFTPETKKE